MCFAQEEVLAALYTTSVMFHSYKKLFFLPVTAGVKEPGGVLRGQHTVKERF